MSHHHLHGTIDAAARIPAVALLLVLEAHLKVVDRVIGMDIGGGIDDKGIVAVRPMACLMTVDIDLGIGHRTVKHELNVLVTYRHGECGLIIALANPWQRARAARLLGGHILAVLLDSDDLQVPFLVKGAIDGPIVGHSHRAPLKLIA